MAIAALGMSLAGFAGIITALDRRDAAESAVVSWRVQHIVVAGFVLTFGGFGTVALYAVLDERLELTVRLMSAGLAIAHGLHARSAISPGPEWSESWNRRWVSVVTSTAVIAALAANVLIADVGLLQVLFVVLVAGPVSVFVATVRDASRLRLRDNGDRD